VFASATPNPIPPAPAPDLTCTPGQDGIPDNLYGALVCGKWAIDAPVAGWHLARAHWPVLLGVVVAAVAVRVAVGAWRTRVWRQHAAQAVWLEITPPVSATPAATVALWRLLATVLPEPRWFALRPHRLVWEVQAGPKGLHCGLWLPPGINPTAVLRILQRAWPGALGQQRTPPAFAPGRPAAAVALCPTQPEWLPLLDEPPSLAIHASRSDGGSRPEDDQMRAVYDGLAAAGRTGGGLLQVIVSRAPKRRLAILHRAGTNPHRARRASGGTRITLGIANLIRAVLLGVIDVFTPGSSATTSRTAPRTDSHTIELARLARAKAATGPHLLIAVRATTTGPTVAAAVAAAADITSGFGLLSARFTRRRLRHPIAVATWRWAPQAQMTLATVAETAALAGLPAEPAAHGLPAAASRRRPVGRDVFTAGPAAGVTRAARPRAPRADQPTPDEPSVWSTP
jgi:hypothetical protein